MKKNIICMIIIAFIIAIANSNIAISQNPDLKLIYKNNFKETESNQIETSNYYGTYNPDSVMVDSNKLSKTYLDKYAKKTFRIQFNPGIYPFKIPLKLNEKSKVAQIPDTKKDLKKEFKIIEKEFGGFDIIGISYEKPLDSYLKNPNHRYWIRKLSEHW